MFLSVAAVGASGAGVCMAQAAPVAPVSTVRIVAFNDLHGNLESPGAWRYARSSAPVASGGIDYFGAYMAQQLAQRRHHVIVAAGDLVGASPLLSARYHDEPTIEALNRLGLEFSAVGNHEFDAGVAELRRKQYGGCHPSGQASCLEGSFAGASFKYLAANVIDTATGRPLFPAYAIRNSGGIRIAFIGIVLRGTPAIVAAGRVAGLEFRDEAGTVNALLPQIEAAHVGAIILLIHQGGVPDPAAGGSDASINDCPGELGEPAESPILDIVARLDDRVDLVVSGHTHAAYNCRLPNSRGRAIPVTQAGAYGRVLTTIDLSFDRRRHVSNIEARNILVSQPDADAPTSATHPYLASPMVARLRELVDAYRTAVAPVANRIIGRIAEPLSNDVDSNGVEPAGELVSDSELAATRGEGRGSAQLAFVNASGVRAPLGAATDAYPRDITYAEAFASRPFGNHLVTLSLSASDLKELLEQQFAGCHGQTGNSFLVPSQGLQIEWSASAPACRKIVRVSLLLTGGGTLSIVADGRVLEPERIFRVTVDDFLASGKSHFTVLLNGASPTDGELDIDALSDYLSAEHQAPQPPYDLRQPASEPRVRRLP